jgi:hypothetical protein
MAGTAKTLVFRDELASELAIRLPALAKTKSFGATGESDLMVGAGTAGSDSVFVRFCAVASIQKDVLGLNQTVFTPHIAQLVIEANPAGGAGADVGTWATRLAVLGAVIAKGTRVEVYTTANTTPVSAAGITGAPTATFEIHPQYALMASS